MSTRGRASAIISAIQARLRRESERPPAPDAPQGGLEIGRGDVTEVLKLAREVLEDSTRELERVATQPRATLAR